MVLEGHHGRALFGGEVPHRLVVEQNVAAGGVEQAGNHLERGGFAASARAE